MAKDRLSKPVPWHVPRWQWKSKEEKEAFGKAKKGRIEF
jgi:hypothetical protein